ncbi:MAG TPA: hypothetical protein VEA78_04100, partial [Acidimicrobiales bacterium]|nr:hypothetical protein [Acidimicrobiales bacterium]
MGGHPAPIGAVQETLDAYATYVNDRFALHGRRIEIVAFPATGSPAADADAAVVMGAFAEIAVVELDHLAALAERGIVGVVGGGSPFGPDLGGLDLGPHGWSLGEPVLDEPGLTFGYAAFKSVRPADEPVGYSEDVYLALHLLATGIQLAGPDLTPSSFEAGVLNMSERTGSYGR